MNESYSCPPSSICNLAGTERIGWISFSWRSSPSILYSCLATLFACTWSILQLNLPGLRESDFRQFIRKLKWTLITLTLPEFIACIALAEFWLARESKKAIRKLGGGQWTLKHGYFANMGGFVLQSRGRNPFPLNSEGLELLVKGGLLDLPDITVSDIEDRSKTNSFARVFSILQVSWMVAQCIGRKYAGLLVTPLEFLSALCIGISFFTYLFEWAKPKDVNVPVLLRYESNLSDELYEQLKEIHARWYNEGKISSNDIRRIPFGAIFKYLLLDSVKKPLYIILLYLLICFVAGGYNGAHLYVSSKLFTPLMYTLWTTCCWIGVASPFVFLAFMFLAQWMPDWFNNCIFFLLGALYCIARIAPFGLGVACFWLSMPAAAYRSLDWVSFIPHF